MQKIIFGVLVTAVFSLVPAVSAQTTISWSAPKYTGATACQHAAELKYADLRDNSKEKTAVDQGRCVPITALKAANAIQQVCADNFSITYVDKTIFPAFEEIDAGKITDPDNYAYPVAMCDTGKLCVVCTQGNVSLSASQGSPSSSASATTAKPSPTATSSGKTSTSSAQVPVSGVLENTLLLLLIGGLVIGLGSYHLVRNKS